MVSGSGALNQRLRPLGHATFDGSRRKYCGKFFGKSTSRNFRGYPPCLKSLRWGVQFNWDMGVKAQGIKRPLFSTGHTSLPPVGELRWDTRSGMVFSGCGIREDTKLLDGIWDSGTASRKWDSTKSWHCMRCGKRKTLFGMEMTEVRDAWLSWKRSWNATPLTRLRRELSVSIRKKYPLEPRVLECGIKTPLLDPRRYYRRKKRTLWTRRLYSS